MKVLPNAGSARTFGACPSTHRPRNAPQYRGVGESSVHGSSVERERLSLTLFGGPLLHSNSGTPIRLTPSHERLVTMVWGHEKRGLSRATAIYLLWEEGDTRRARQRLRQLLHDLSLRVGLRPVARASDDYLAPEFGLVPSDLEAFRDALDRRDLRAALALYRLGFAVRLDGRSNTEEYEDWLASKRETLRRRLRDTAASEWDRRRSSSALHEARDAAEVLAAIEPDSESAVMKLVESCAIAGDLEAAEAAARDYLAGPSKGLKLSKTWAELLARVRRMNPLHVPVAPTKPPPPPFIGRSDHLAAARRILRRVAEGNFEFLLIKGESGVGKSRFVDELTREAILSGFTCLVARPTELEQRIPLNVLVDMLGNPSVTHHILALEEPWRSVITALLPTLPNKLQPPVVPPIAEMSLTRRLFDAFAILFSQIVAHEPLLLLIDDFQWADATTVAILQFVQRRWRAGPFGVVVTVRPDQASGRDALDAYMTETRDLPVTSIELGELPESAARALVDFVATQALEAPITSRLLAVAGRNPFYLIELTRDYLAGEVQLPELPMDAVLLPISLRQLLEPRIEALTDGAASVSAYLAAFGRWVTLPDLARLTCKPEDGVAVDVETLEQCRLVSVERGRVRLAHELFRSAVYQRLSATRRSFLHGEIGTFLEQTGSQQPGEIAIHYDRAGNAPGAAKKAREAADHALESGAMSEAAYFLQLVVENVADGTLKAEATADLARALHMDREIGKANPTLELAATRLRAMGDQRKALRMDVRRVEGLAELGAAPLSELLDRIATVKALARSSKDDEVLALALDTELHLLHRAGRVEQIGTLFEEIRSVASSSNPAGACLANGALALNVFFGDAAEGLRCAREAVGLAEEAQQYQLRSEARLFVALYIQGLGKTPEAHRTLTRARTLAQKSGDLLIRSHIENNAGLAHIDACELDEAATCFDAVNSILRGADASMARLGLYYNLGELAFLRGDLADALSTFTAAECLLTSSTMPQDAWALTNAAIGLCSLEIGALGEARRREGLMGTFPTSWHFDPTMVLTFAARLLETRGRQDEALRLLREHNQVLRHRFPVAWMKLAPIEARFARRAGERLWKQLLFEAAERAHTLGMPGRAQALLDVTAY